MHKTSTPTHKTSTSIHKTSTPIHKTNAPIHKTSTPVHKTSTPIRKTSTPAHATSTPIHKTSIPIHETSTQYSRLVSQRIRDNSMMRAGGARRAGDGDPAPNRRNLINNWMPGNYQTKVARTQEFVHSAQNFAKHI